MIITDDDILNASILIVDDQESNVMLLEQLLREAGYSSVTSTMKPAEVCGLHADNCYDLILLDLQMPVMDGFQVMEGLQANDRDDYLSVLVITVEPDHKLRALQAGAKDFISKPFDLLEVKTRIHNLLEVRLLYKKLKNFSIQLQNSHDELETIVHQRTFELTRANMQLTEEITERTRTEASLQASYEEIQRLKEKLQAENIYLQQEVEGQFNFGEIVGQSPLLSRVFLLVDQVSSMNATVLLLGETGTGMLAP